MFYDMLNLQQFRVLVAVKEQGSLTGAAELLRYGVPTVTHHLRALERHLQARLIDSSRSGTRLTPLGMSFAAEVEKVLERIERAERMIADQRDAGVVTLRVATFSSMGSRLLPSAIAELRTRSPLQVGVIEAEPTEVIRMIRNEEVDAGLIYDSSDAPAFAAPDLSLTLLMIEPYEVMVAKRGPWNTTEALDLNDVDLPWIFSRSDNEASDRILRRVYAMLGREARELMRTDDLYTIHGFVEKGLGLALTTRTTVDTDFEVAVRPTRQDLGERHVAFVMPRDAPPPAAIWLRDILRVDALKLGDRARR